MAGDTDSDSSSASAPAHDELPAAAAAASAASSACAAPPSAAELARLAQQEALMERLMERKLAVLEAEYNACIDAESRAAQQRTAAEEAALHGYGRVGTGVQHGGQQDGGSESDEEFSPAWTRFKADMKEERLRQQAAGVESDDGNDRPAMAQAGQVGQAGQQEEKEERVMHHAPLTSDQISSIKSVMSGIKLRPPPWAVGMPEDVWMARILERAGFVRRAVQARRADQQPEPQLQQPVSEAERKRRKDKKKARKARQAKEVQQSQQQQTAADSGAGADRQIAAAPFSAEDFETIFPAMPSPRSSPQPTALNSDSVTQTA